MLWLYQDIKTQISHVFLWIRRKLFVFLHHLCVVLLIFIMLPLSFTCRKLVFFYFFFFSFNCASLFALLSIIVIDTCKVSKYVYIFNSQIILNFNSLCKIRVSTSKLFCEDQVCLISSGFSNNQ